MTRSRMVSRFTSLSLIRLPGSDKLPEEKYKLEDSGFRYLESLLKPFNDEIGVSLREAWLEYENRETKEAKYVYEVDKLECIIQAHEYEQRTHGEKDFEEFQGYSSKIKSSMGKEWLELLRQERQAHFSKRRNRSPVIFVIGTFF